ncbi:sulfiredoxin, chloroplastic/mitochondrial isoform X1 [Prosopis cineraria]|uniref:sulfiredoxin, chloroplastic/mitochondrial isoform X1 n=1 Tax=Prosopis cineraria TaxID=364024 RepID=UPI00240EB65E|nr:sulfiredoxin, chloroplastic/mitochondrial isoform X1 [Prosopis cineraria]
MANFVLQVPSRLRTFPVFSSSNGASPSASGTGGVGAGGPVILELPLERIRRPLMRTRANDPNKVKELMDSISEIGLQVPVQCSAAPDDNKIINFSKQQDISSLLLSINGNFFWQGCSSEISSFAACEKHLSYDVFFIITFELFR